MYLRRKRNKSGSVSIVMVDKSGSSYREIKVIGTSSEADELEWFALGAGRWMAHDGGQLELDFDEGERVFRRHERCIYNIGFNTDLFITSNYNCLTPLNLDDESFVNQIPKIHWGNNEIIKWCSHCFCKYHSPD